MKRLCCWSVVLCVCLAALTAPQAPGGDAKRGDKDAKRLQGTWKPATGELAGNPLPDDFVKNTTLVIADGKYTATVGENKDEGTWKHDATKKPPTMEITSTKGPKAGKTLLAIYELNGDTLRICYDLTGKAYPKEFKTAPKTTLFLVEYKRQKP